MNTGKREYFTLTTLIGRGKGAIDVVTKRNSDLNSLGMEGWSLVSTVAIEENSTIGFVDTLVREY